MSIYTITLKRELLDDFEERETVGEAGAQGKRREERRGSGRALAADEPQRLDNDVSKRASKTDDSQQDNTAAGKLGRGPASEANEFNLNDANWLDCCCDEELLSGRDETTSKQEQAKAERTNAQREEEDKENNKRQHSSRCIEARREQLRELRKRAKQIVHSVNVTLEVAADLSQASRIVWYKNQSKQLTSSESPVFYAKKKQRKTCDSDSSVGQKRPLQQEQQRLATSGTSSGGEQRSIRRTRSKRIKSLKSTSEGGVSVEEETTTEIEEELSLIVGGDENDGGGGENNSNSLLSATHQGVCGGKRDLNDDNLDDDEAEEVLIEKCKQESSDKGSKLTIFDLQDEDYGQYTCRLIDNQGNQVSIETKLKQDKSSASSNNHNQGTSSAKTAAAKTTTSEEDRRENARRGTNLVGMDEVIEVKEGDLNIELGIQILPETNEDEELMSEEEKAEFIENTSINWFKDDVKLNQSDPQVLKLFQFTYDQVEGFHRLIVRKATKETEGVYTCLVENESGTSSCSTQLIVGPGNKPKLTSQLQDVTVYVGQSLEFRIKSTGLPPIDSCQWFKDDELLIELATGSTRVDEPVKSRRNERVSMSRSEEWSSATREDKDKVLIFRLCIDSLKLDDSGRYKCRINNEHGYDESSCFVRVLQEIIEEHEEVEETIEETMRLGGGKKSTREEEEEITTREELIEKEEAQEVKRQKYDDDEDSQPMAVDGGQAPRFKRTLVSKTFKITEEEETTRTTTTTTTTRRVSSASASTVTEELLVSTVRDQWSSRRDSLKVKWLVDGREISSTTSTVDSRDESISYKVENFYDETSDEIKHKLVIKYKSSGVRDGRARTIECCASNEHGSAKTHAQVRWLKKPRFVRKLEDQETTVNESVTLKVTVVDEEDQQVDDLRLLKDGQLLYSSKRDGFGEKQLKSRVTVRSYEETVEVEEICEEQEQEDDRYSSARRYSRRTSSSLSGSGRRTKSVRRKCRSYEVIIEKVRVDQQGTWECQAENEAGVSSCRADLEVFAEPKIVTDLPAETRVSPAKEIRLTVEASGSPTPVFSWFKDGLGIAEEEDRVFTETSKSSTTTTSTSTKSTTSTTKRRSSVTSMRSGEDGTTISGETLIIRDAKPEDAGSYQCKVENRLGQVESRTCEMVVIGHGEDLKGAPKIIKDLSRVEIDEGETVLLKVLAEGHPRPSQHWFKDNKEIVVDETTTTTTTTTTKTTRTEVEQTGQEYKMTIRRSRVEDSGKYKVLLRNEHGEIESRTVEVKVRKVSNEQESQRRPSAPTIISDSQDKVVGVGSNVSFDVQVAGHPKPLITWYKNGRRMTESGDGRVSFVEEEETVTTTTTTVTESGEDTGEKSVRKETTTIHKLVIRDVRESDEAIYSLKAENDLGSNKSSLVSLSVDKRKSATDEISESKSKRRAEQAQEEVIEEEVTTTETTTTEVKTTQSTTEEEEEEARELERRRRAESSSVYESEDELDEDGNKKRKQTTRTTRTTTTKTTTTTTQEEQELEDEEARKRRRVKEALEERVDEEEEETSKKSKRRVVEEDALEERKLDEDEETRRTKRKVRKDDEEKVVDMEVDEAEDENESQEDKRRRSSKSKSRRKSSVDEIVEHETIEEEEEEVTKTRRRAPRILSAPKEVVAGLGSTPELEVLVEEEIIEEEEEILDKKKKNKQKKRDQETTTTTTTVVEEVVTKITWLKDNQPIPDRLTRDNHIEFIERPGDTPGTKKRIMRINSLRTSDEGEYTLKVENPAGTAETAPIKVAVDRSMRPGQRASITPADIVPVLEQRAPEIVSVPEEVVAGIGSSPVIEAEIEAEPKPKLTWFKDGQPIPADELKKPNGHLEVVDLPTDKPNVVKQALKINDLKPDDAAAYHVKAENPLGEVESEPTNVRIDRSMGPKDEPQVSGLPEEPEVPQKVTRPVDKPKESESAPAIVSAPEEVKAGPGSNPQIEAEVSGSPAPQLTWLKDGKPITDRDLRSGHVEIVDLPTDKPGTIKQALKINDLRPNDVADYQVKAENPLGEVESQPTKLKLDRTMSPRDEPVVTGLDSVAPDSAQPLKPGAEKAPEIVSMPDEVKAGPGSSPQIVAEVTGKPLPEVNWLKDGQPIPDRDLRVGHVEVVDLPTDKPDTIKQALKIHDLRPTDVADYQVKAVNPLGEVESEPAKLKLDRSMGPRDEPLVSGQEPADGAPDGQKAPAIVKLPEEVKAGPGSSPQIVAEVTGKPLPEINWLKDGQPIPERDLRLGHVEVVDLPTDKPDTIKQALKINDLRPADVAEYQVAAKNPLGEVVSQPTQLKLDRRMSSRDAPEEKPAPSDDVDDEKPSRPSGEGGRAPEIISVPEEVRAGRGGSPEIEAEVAGEPKPKLTWLKDGQPISERDLRTGHVEIVDLPTDRPDSVKQALKINDLRPTDVADYQVKAENPLGTIESKPTSVKIDRSMSSSDKPVVEGLDQPEAAQPDDLRSPATKRLQDLPDDACAPSIVSAPEEVVAARGAAPQIEAEVAGKPVPEMTWFKDGQPLDQKDLDDGHLEVVDLPTDQPEETRKQALKINDLKPDDAAAYHVKAENPLGEAESEPTNVRIDRSMKPTDEPIVTGLPEKLDTDTPIGGKPKGGEAAPAIVSLPEEVKAGPGSRPQIEAEVSGSPAPQLTWLKDGQPITDRDLRSGHVEIVDLPTDKPDTIKQALKINDLRPNDVADYQVKAENPLGEVESQPAKLKLDRRMSQRDEPVVTGLDSPVDLPGAQKAPKIVSMPDEVKAGPGSSPQIVAEVTGKPLPELTWLKDGSPITDRDLRLGHVEVVDLPTDKPDTIKQALKISDLRPTDAADYQVKAENPLGSVESHPTKMKLDRTMSSRDKPVVEGLDSQASESAQDLPGAGDMAAPEIASMPDEVKAGPGSSPQIVAEVTGKPLPEVNWLKDGQPIPERDLRSGHVEVVDLPTDKPDTVKQGLKINDLRPNDVADYQVKAKNPLGEVESEPAKLKLDRSMSIHDEPVVKGDEPKEALDSPSGKRAPTIVSLPKEVVAGPGASPEIVAEVTGKPLPEINWLKDGKPIPDRDLRNGHVQVVDLPSDKPDTLKQALKINDLKPSDVADYQVKAENPLGKVESEPAHLKLDRSMGPQDEPLVESAAPEDQADDDNMMAPTIVSMPDEIVAGPGSSPKIVAEVSGKPLPEITWFKDGAPIAESDLDEGHVQIVDLPTNKPDTLKQALKMSDLKPSDAAAYHVKAENDLGDTESQPTNLRLDRKMSAKDAPQVAPEPADDADDVPMDVSTPTPAAADRKRSLEMCAPEIVSAPKEVVCAPGSSPKLEVEVKAAPKANVEWLKDGEPIPARLLRDNHIELVEEQTPVDGVTKHSLKINEARPSDVAAYTLRAENPLGEASTEPIALKTDRSMSKSDEPHVVPAAGAPGAGGRPLDTDDLVAPKIVSAPEEVVAGPGSSPQIVAEVSGKPLPEITWFKDGLPITDRDLARGHVEVVDLPTDKPDTLKQALKINELKPADAAAYHVKAENPAGTAESTPTNVRLDRTMAPGEEPIVSDSAAPLQGRRSSTPASKQPTEGQRAPKIVSAPREVVAGPGSSPQLETEISGKPLPEVTWFKDGAPITDRDLRDGHLEVIDLPTDKPDTLKQALKINNMKPTDVAAYHVEAENPAGKAESAPTKVRLDRSMSSLDEPIVKGLAGPSQVSPLAGPQQGDAFAPTIVSVPEEVVAGRGASPQVEARVAGNPTPELSWFKDGQPLDESDLASGHIELIDLPCSTPNELRQALKINDMKPSDAAAYHVKAENPLGEAESEPTNVRFDRTMGADDKPQVSGGAPAEPIRLPQIARNIKCPLGSSPVLDVEVTGGVPDKIEWLKDGQVVKEKPDMHIEVESLPDGTQKLHINNFKPEDVGVYKLRASNDAGTVESGPISVSAADDVRDTPRAKQEPAAAEFAPKIINATEEVVAGPGSHPQLEVHVRAQPAPEIAWYKDGKPLAADKTGHVALAVEKSPYAPDALKYVLKVDRMKPADAGTYKLIAKNPLGSADSKPLQLRLDRALEPDESPLVKRTLDDDELAAAQHAAPVASPGDFAPQILETPEEVVAGIGSSPSLEVAIKARPAPQTTWFKDGQPLTQEELSAPDGHLEVVRQQSPDDKDLVHESLRIKDLKPADVAAYHVKAKNPLGEVESEPTNVRIDRAMKPTDEPQVSTIETPFSPEEAQKSAADKMGTAPSIRRIPRKVVAPLGGSPVLEVEIAGEPKPEIVWLKDGRQVSDVRNHIALVELPDGTCQVAFTNVKAVDQGDYVIKATNPFGEVQSAPIALVIDSQMSPRDEPRVIDSLAAPQEGEPGALVDKTPMRGFAPKIVRVSDQVMGDLGGAVSVQVEVCALPEANVSWLLDGQQIPARAFEEEHMRVSAEKSPSKEDTTIYTLDLTALKPSDAGTYQLVAENPFGTVRSPAIAVTLRPTDDELDFQKPTRKLRAPVIKRAPKQVVAREGTSPILEVEVSGEPIPEIVWFRNGKRIERTDAHFTFEELPEEGVFRLVVHEVTKADEANYTVLATNEAGSDESSPIELRVTPKVAGFAPQVVGATEEVVAGAGSSPAMEIVIKASPVAKVEWFRDGQPLDLTTRENKKKYEVREEKCTDEKDTTKYTLVIKDLRPLDTGAYHARAENVHGCTESEPINVRIDRDMAADAAPQATFAEFAPSDADEAGAVQPDDSSARSRPGKRNIRAPTIKRMPRRIVAGLGSNPTIEVVISGEPKPEVVWFKNGKRLKEVKEHIEFEEVSTGDGETTVFKICFTNVKMTDQAEYSVVATNEAGTIDSGAIELIVDRKLSSSLEPLVMDADELPAPIVVANADGPIEAPAIKGLDDRVKAAPGQTVKLEAEVTGNPRPDIKWLKDGDEVELNIVNEVPDSNRHSLTLRNVNDLYDGVYSLEAKNEAGVARKEARVEIVDSLPASLEPTSATYQQQEQPTSVKRKSVDEPKMKPFIKKGLKFSQVNQGRSIKFEVQIDGKYDELIWTKDGEQINVPFEVSEYDHDEDVTMRVPTGASPEDGDGDDDDASTIKADSDDEERATATGPATGVSGKPKRKFAPRILMRPRNIVTGPGSRVAFEVRFEGEPRPEVIWYKNGERVKSTMDGKIVIEEVSEDMVRLVIEDVQEDDVATYQVVVENPYGQEKSLPVTLELDEQMPASDDLANYFGQPADSIEGGPLKRGRAPRILSRPRPVHAAPGSTVAFEVQVAGEPKPVVNWFRDGRIITQTSDGHVRIEEYSNGCVRLVLSDITDADVGQYHVSAENKLGSERTIPVSLTIDETSTTIGQVEDFCEISQVSDQVERQRRGGRPPRILLRPKRLSAPQGGEVTLDVLVVGQSKPSIIWYKDGKRIQVDGRRVRVEEVSESYQRLVISELTTSDAGSYSVSAENDFGVSMSQPPATLEITSEGTTTKSSGATSASSTTLEEITTTTTTTEEETTTSFYEHFVNDDDLLHPGDKVPGAKRAPRFTLKPRNKKAPLGSKVDFEVKVSGTPKPDVVWYKNGLRVHTTPDGRVRIEEFSDGGSKLIIEDLEETDAAVYSAEATNEWGRTRTDDVQLRVTQRTEVSERTERKQRGGATVTTRTKKTRSHYTFSEERHGYVTLTLNDAQLEHDGDYKLVVRNKWGEASTQAPLVVIPKVEPRSAFGADRNASRASYDDRSSDGRDSRSRRTPFDELEDYGHELDKSVGTFASESHYQSGEDTYLLQLRDTEFPLRLRKYLRFGARQSPSLRSNLMDAHWGAGARVTVRERRKFREVMDEEIDDEKSGRDSRPTPMRLQQEVGTCNYAAAQLESLRVQAAERVARRSAEGGPSSVVGGTDPAHTDMMPPFFRVKLKDAIVEEGPSGQQAEAVFACHAAGEPRPDYTWFRNDAIITPDVARMQINVLPDGGCELRIRDPRLHDAGCFKCVAFNVHGNVTTRARLRVAGRPSRPEPPECSGPVTAHEVFLMWRPPRDNIYDANSADILGYRLEMSQSSVGEDDQWTVLAADIGHEFYVVDDLRPATSYTFRVSARNKFGWSDTSYSAYVTTARADAENVPARLAVPHEMRARQYVSEVCDSHVLRTCEDEKYPKLNYALEQLPVSAETGSSWRDAYSLQAEIARGRFSIISKGLRKADQQQQQPQQVVLKFVPASLASAAQTKNEFDILRSLQHEKVARLYAAYKQDDAFVFVLERLSGLDVLTYLSSFTQYNEETVSQIIQQVMDAIEYLHFRGMCLLELQPDNVVMTNGRTTSLKLVDFSSARFVPRSGARVPVNASQTIEYCPPEVIAGHEVDTASDVWCIGVLTYVLLSGFSPFKGDSEDETRENVRLGRYKYDHIYANCTPEVTRFLINVFKKHSSKRPTIEQLYENKWLLPNEHMIRKRQHATFRTDKIAVFADEFHKMKQQQQQHYVADLQQLAGQLNG